MSPAPQSTISFGLSSQKSGTMQSEPEVKQDLSPSKQDDESEKDEITELFTASRNDDDGEEIDVSTGTFGGK